VQQHAVHAKVRQENRVATGLTANSVSPLLVAGGGANGLDTSNVKEAESAEFLLHELLRAANKGVGTVAPGVSAAL
jgi:hypothetical protein